MGLFGRKPAKSATVTLQPYPLREGTQVEMVDVDKAFIARGRNGPKSPRLGHTYPVSLFAIGGDVLVFADQEQVGRLVPTHADFYIGELTRLQHQGRIGTTVAFVKPEGWANQQHSVSLNWSENAPGGGGIL